MALSKIFHLQGYSSDFTHEISVSAPSRGHILVSFIKSNKITFDYSKDLFRATLDVFLEEELRYQQQEGKVDLFIPVLQS